MTDEQIQFYNMQFQGVPSSTAIPPYISIFKVDVEETLPSLLNRFIDKMFELYDQLNVCDLQDRMSRAFYVNHENWGRRCILEMISKKDDLLYMAYNLRDNSNTLCILENTSVHRCFMVKVAKKLHTIATYLIEQWINFKAIQNQRLDCSRRLESNLSEMLRDLEKLGNSFPSDRSNSIEDIRHTVLGLHDPIRRFAVNYATFTPDMVAMQMLISEVKDHMNKLYRARRELLRATRMMRFKEPLPEEETNGLP